MSSKPQTSNDLPWERLFEQHQILEHVQHQGYAEITAAQINQYREARLMTKFDHRSNLPRLFATHRLAILPVTRGSYVIAPFSAYESLPRPVPAVDRIRFPAHIHSIDSRQITSEATAINCAYLSNIFSDFLGEERLLPTVSGRMGSGQFAFCINSYKGGQLSLEVNQSQVEIDGGYEGTQSLTLIEAKNALSDDFLIRQLYYPFRLWQQKIGAIKQIRSVFMVYSGGIFSLYEYAFQDPASYNSLVLVQQKNYSIDPEKMTEADLLETYQQARVAQEPTSIPFPQADRFERIVNLCELLHEHGSLTREEITRNYDFDVRQTSYYADAARYLGLVEKCSIDDQKGYELTPAGKALFFLSIKQRKLAFARSVMEKKAFHLVLAHYFEQGILPDKAETIHYMKHAELHKIGSENTYSRRSSTVLSWAAWVIQLCKQ